MAETVFLLTFADMKTYLGMLLGEPDASNSRWNNDQRELQLNISQLELATDTHCLEETWESSVGIWASDGDETVALDNSFFDDAMLNIWWVNSDGDQTEMDEIHPTHDDISYDTDDTGTPSKYFRVGRNITMIPPASAAGTIKIIGKRLPDALDGDTDQTLIHAAFRQAVCYDAAAILCDGDHEHNKSMRYEQRYQNLRRQLKAHSNRARQRNATRFRLPIYIP